MQTCSLSGSKCYCGSIHLISVDMTPAPYLAFQLHKPNQHYYSGAVEEGYTYTLCDCLVIPIHWNRFDDNVQTDHHDFMNNNPDVWRFKTKFLSFQISALVDEATSAAETPAWSHAVKPWKDACRAPVQGEWEKNLVNNTTTKNGQKFLNLEWRCFLDLFMKW